MSKGTVYKRRDGRWECRISMGKDDNGKRVFKSFYGKSREEAEYKAMIALDHSEDEYAVTEMTVRELVTRVASRYSISHQGVNRRQLCHESRKAPYPCLWRDKVLFAESQRYIRIYRKKAERGIVGAVSVGYYGAVQVRVPLCKP